MWLTLTVATLAATGANAGKRFRAKGFDQVARSNLILTLVIVTYAATTNTPADALVWQVTGLGGVVTLIAGIGLTWWAVGVIQRHEDLFEVRTMLPNLVGAVGFNGTVFWWASKGLLQQPPNLYDLVGVVAFDFVAVAAFLVIMRTGTYLARDWNGPTRHVGFVYILVGGAGAAVMSLDLLFAGSGNPYLIRWMPIVHLALYVAPLAFTWVAQHGLNQPPPTPSNRRRLTFSLADGLGFDNDHRPPRTSGRSDLPDSTMG